MNPTFKGYLLGAVAAATYGMNPLFALPLYQAGMNPDSVLFFRYAIGLPLLAAMLIVRRGPRSIVPGGMGEIGSYFVMGMLMAVSSLTLFESYNHMAAGIASTMLFVYPVMVALLMAAFFHERMPLTAWFCVLAALGGIALLYKGEEGATLSLTGTLLVMASALTYALYLIGVNHSHLKDVATLKVTFYVLLAGMLLFVTRLLTVTELTLPPSWWLWGNVVCLAVFPTVISFLCTTTAIRYIGSTPTAILGALEPVTAIVFGVLVFDERLTPRDCLGLALILGAVTLLIAGGRITHPLMRIRKLFPRLPWLKR